MLIDQSGQRKAMLKMGEHKSIQTDRVVLVRGRMRKSKLSGGFTGHSLTKVKMKPKSPIR